MMGTWVQERWDGIALTNVNPNADPNQQTFYVNLPGQKWVTSRGVDQNSKGKGVFTSPDYVGYKGIPHSLWAGDQEMYIGSHVYWAGTSWCPILEPEFLGSLFLKRFIPVIAPAHPKPNAGYGLGVRLGKYDVVIKTKGPTHAKVNED